MKYKILKHKILEKTFGMFYESSDAEFGIIKCYKPELFEQEITIDYIKQLYEKSPEILAQLEDYDLVEVELSYVKSKPMTDEEVGDFFGTIHNCKYDNEGNLVDKSGGCGNPPML